MFLKFDIDTVMYTQYISAFTLVNRDLNKLSPKTLTDSFMDICLRSRPVSPNVVRSSVRGHVEKNRMTG